MTATHRKRKDIRCLFSVRPRFLLLIETRIGSASYVPRILVRGEFPSAANALLPQVSCLWLNLLVLCALIAAHLHLCAGATLLSTSDAPELIGLHLTGSKYFDNFMKKWDDSYMAYTDGKAVFMKPAMGLWFGHTAQYDSYPL
jgi:hypothetical protein